VLKLMYAALIPAAERWHALKMTDLERRQLKAIREPVYPPNRGLDLNDLALSSLSLCRIRAQLRFLWRDE
jgi:hypothetical protein